MRLVLLSVMFAASTLCNAGDNFANNRDDILKMLTADKPSTPRAQSQQTTQRKTRSIRGLRPVVKQTAKPYIQQTSYQVLTNLGKTDSTTLPTTSSSVNLKIEFDVNSASIRSSSFRLLNQLGEALTDSSLASEQFLVGGHTDSDGSDKSNLKLSLKRAKAVKEFLVKAVGVDSDRLKVVGYGESTPVISNSTRQGKQKNRRVEILKVND
jgi:outer membrane protein OmpA-like peptidoglycan-associated protein